MEVGEDEVVIGADTEEDTAEGLATILTVAVVDGKQGASKVYSFGSDCLNRGRGRGF